MDYIRVTEQKRPRRTLRDVSTFGPSADGPGAVTHGDAVSVVRWPSQTAWRDELAGQGRARLLLVESDYDPPAVVDALEDWAREGVDPVEVYVRCEWLRQRQRQLAPVVLDEDGLLWRDGRWAALSPMEQRVAAPLLQRPGRLVKRAALLAVIRPGAPADERRAVDSVVGRLRRRIAPLGLTVHTVQGTGFVLDAEALPG